MRELPCGVVALLVAGAGCGGLVTSNGDDAGPDSGPTSHSDPVDSSTPRSDTSPAPFDGAAVLDGTPQADAGGGDVSTGCFPPPSGIVSWWRGEGDATDSVGPNSGTAIGSVTYAPGFVGQAFLFNGDGYIDASSSEMPVGSADRTLELWARIDSTPSHEAFFAGYGAFGTRGETYHLGSLGDAPFFSQWGTGVGSATPFALTTWHHVAVTNVGSKATLYIDAVPVGPNIVAIMTPAETSFYIGQIPGDPTRALTGAVDEVTIYNRALTAAEIAGIYAAGSAGKCR